MKQEVIFTRRDRCMSSSSSVFFHWTLSVPVGYKVGGSDERTVEGSDVGL